MTGPPSEFQGLYRLARAKNEWRRSWVFVQRINGDFVETDYLQTGMRGAIGLEGPIRFLQGDTGWIGTGSNHFVVTEVVEFEDIPDVSFVIGHVERGGFHISRHNLQVRKQGPEDQPGKRRS